MLNLRWQQAIFVWTDLRKECVTLKLLQDSCDKQSTGPRGLHQLLGGPQKPKHNYRKMKSVCREQIDYRYILHMTPLQKTRTIPLCMCET